MTVSFELDGQPFIALNGGPQFTFTEAISFSVELRDAAGSRRVLGQALGGRRGRPLRLAERQIRPVLAGQSGCPGKTVERSGSGEIETGHGSDAQDEEDRHRDIAAGLRRRGALSVSHKRVAGRLTPPAAPSPDRPRSRARRESTQRPGTRPATRSARRQRRSDPTCRSRRGNP